MAATRTVRDILTRSMRVATILGAGEPMDADDANDALLSLNQMLDAWQAERLFAYAVVERVHPLTTGIGTYTVGVGGAINVPRPIRVEYAYTRDSQGYDRPLEIITDEQFANISLKSLGNIFPAVLYYEPTYPLGSVNLWPLPQADLTLRFGAWEVLTEYASLNDTVILPPGYEDAIVFSLSERISPEYGKPISPDLARMAQKARANIQQNNLPEPFMACEFLGGGANEFLPWYAYRAGNF